MFGHPEPGRFTERTERIIGGIAAGRRGHRQCAALRIGAPGARRGRAHQPAQG
jgi:hypothetical protein